MRLLLPLLLPSLLLAKDLPVANAEAFTAALKQAQPGDNLVLADGEWKDAALRFVAEGTKEQHITIKAATPGKTVFTGNSSLSFDGHSIHVEGLHFRDPSQLSGEVIEFRKDSKALASDCILRDCAVTSSAPVNLGKQTARFCSIYGTNNTVERCHFEGKTPAGTTLVVWLKVGEEARHVIRDNYFGPRPRLGKNGGETIRLGDSETHDTNAKCDVSGNSFYRCNGETEIISVKSNENRLLNNSFVECEGTLTLRHAHRCLVKDNIFIGNHQKQTGGIRIIGEDHLITGNYLESLEGDGYRAAFTFMKGIPNSPANGYYEVKRATLVGNTALDCKVTLAIGEGERKEATLPPQACTVKDNIFVSAKHPLVVQIAIGDGWTWQNNVMTGKNLGVASLPGIRSDSAPAVARKSAPARDAVGVTWLR